MDRGSDAWFDRELAGCNFADERLSKRLRKLVAQIGSAMGQSIPLVCQDWANTKAAYRFFSNERVSEADILAGHFQSTRDRTAATDGLVLVLHDTTEFSYTRENSEAIGITAPPDLALTAAEIGLLDNLAQLRQVHASLSARLAPAHELVDELLDRVWDDRDLTLVSHVSFLPAPDTIGTR